MPFRWTSKQNGNTTSDIPESKTKVYEVVEFVNLKPGNQLVSVLRYRTFYYPDGKIRRERIPNTGLLRSMIQDYSGYSVENGATLIGFFDAPEDAAKCAKAINHICRNAAEVCGTQVVVDI